MTKFEFEFTINNMHNVLNDKKKEIKVDDTIFKYNGNQNYSSLIIVESENQIKAEKKAKHLINIALSKICFSYASEAKLDEYGYCVTNLSANPPSRHLCKSVVIRYRILGWKPENLLEKMGDFPKERMNVLEISLLYLKLSILNNPLRIESLFSSMTAIIRDHYKTEYVDTYRLKNGIKEVLKRKQGFDEKSFEEDWKQCYAEERCSIAHGRKSQILDIAREYESEELINRVYSWASELIVFYINTYSNMK